MKMKNLQIELLSADARIPTKATPGAANADLYSAETTYIGPGKTEKVSTGLRMRVPEGYVLEIYPRSGLASEGLQVANSPGQVDSDYRGEVRVLLFNSTSLGTIIHEGDRIAQCRLVSLCDTTIERVNSIDVDETERGDGGFGSTGKA